MNIFVHGRERITGIDLDKFSSREPKEFDAGYFLRRLLVSVTSGRDPSPALRLHAPHL